MVVRTQIKRGDAIKAIRMGMIALSFATNLFAGDDIPVVYKPLSIAALQEFGQLQSGQFGTTGRFKNEWVDHFGAFLTQTVLVGNNLTINVGLGGLFQFPKEEIVGPAWGSTQSKNFYVGPTVADVIYGFNWGDMTGSVGLGMFNYKYNSDAANLGEYLFRTGAYPTYISSGGYAFVNANQAYCLQGLKSNFSTPNFSTDLFLLTETGLAPYYDLSLAAVVQYHPFNGMIDLFGGVAMKRLVSARPSRTTRKVRENSYFIPKGESKYFSGNPNYYREQKSFYERKILEAEKAGTDTMVYAGLRDSLDKIVKNLTDKGAWVDSTTGLPLGAQFYSISATTITVGAAFDFKKLFGDNGVFGPKDLRLYSEIALLGIQNHPVFYEDRLKRLPVMFGFNLPAFGILDQIALQYEWFDSPWLNSYRKQGDENIALPDFPLGTSPVTSKNYYNDAASNDNHSWSLLIRKEMLNSLSVSAQLARDHIRSVSNQVYGGPGTDPNEILTFSSDWYLMLQFSLGI